MGTKWCVREGVAGIAWIELLADFMSSPLASKFFDSVGVDWIAPPTIESLIHTLRNACRAFACRYLGQGVTNAITVVHRMPKLRHL
eukprot:15367342-Alexandrium_andersonii.AAC.1